MLTAFAHQALELQILVLEFGRTLDAPRFLNFSKGSKVVWWREAATQSDGVFITPAVGPAVAGTLCVPAQTNAQWTTRSC